MPAQNTLNPADMWTQVKMVRETQPLIQNITNEVVTELTAEAIVALGGSQASLWGAEEAKELAAFADAQVVNVGTPSGNWLTAAREATAVGHTREISWVLDPVGYGVLPYRTQIIDELLGNHPSVIKGNAFEIMNMAGIEASGKGADSISSSHDAEDAAHELALRHQCVVAVTGASDLVTDGKNSIRLENGDKLMAAHIGTGCMAGAVIGCLLAVTPDPYQATVAGLACFGVAGEIAAEKSQGPGSLRVNLIDALYGLDGDTFSTRLKA